MYENYNDNGHEKALLPALVSVSASADEQRNVGHCSVILQHYWVLLFPSDEVFYSMQNSCLLL